jgi:uncharacterized RDD family membrane protein YckC
MRPLQQAQHHAGLGVRIAAFALDYLIITVYLILIITLTLSVNRIFPNFLRTLFDNPVSGQVTGFMLVTLPVTIYFVLLESSSWQSTLGKRWKRLRVVDKNNGRLSRMRAFGRTLLKFIPWELSHACIWQIRFSAGNPSPMSMLGFTVVWILIAANIASLLVSPTHQALYDRLAGSYVVINKRTIKR